MMHDDAQREEEQANLVGVIRWAVTIDTTNKEPRPEVPPQGTGERGELSDLLATCCSSRHH